MGRASRSSATAASRCSAAARRPRKRERPPGAPPADPMNAPETIIPAEAPPAQEDKRAAVPLGKRVRSEEHTSELQSLMRNSYAVFCLKKKKYTILVLI